MSVMADQPALALSRAVFCSRMRIGGFYVCILRDCASD